MGALFRHLLPATHRMAWWQRKFLLERFSGLQRLRLWRIKTKALQYGSPSHQAKMRCFQVNSVNYSCCECLPQRQQRCSDSNVEQSRQRLRQSFFHKKLSIFNFQLRNFPWLSMCHNNEWIRLGYARNCRFHRSNSDLLETFQLRARMPANDQSTRGH